MYQTLPTSSSIRLLKRLGVDENGLLNFASRVVDLHDLPSYHCLSYTWGNPHADGTIFRQFFESQGPLYSERCHTILIDGKAITIQKNLDDAMKQLPTDAWARRVNHTYAHLGGQSVLHFTAKMNSPNGRANLQTHLRHGANPSMMDFDGRTPAHYAAMCCNFAALQMLINAGADIKIKDNDGKFPIAYSWEQNDKASVQLLIECMMTKTDSVNPDTTASTRPPLLDDYIWIDALCINQEDVLERNTQVAMMNMIYERAGYVLVWLGEEDQWTEAAVGAVKKIMTNPQKFKESSIVPFTTCNTEEFEQQGLSPICRQEWDSLAALMARQWFRRIWVLQEVVLAPDLVMYCGKHEILFGELSRMLMVLRRLNNKVGYEPSLQYIPLDQLATSVEYHFLQTIEMRTNRHALKEKWDFPGARRPSDQQFALRSLIPYTMPFHATDPRDKIYALLALTEMCRDLRTDVQPQYQLSTEQCFAWVTIELIKDFGSLEVLEWVQTSNARNISALPSWVPDFSSRGLNLLPPLSTDALNLLPAATFSVDITKLPNLILGVQGIEYDVVKRVAGPKLPKLHSDPSWFELVADIPSNYHTGQAIGEVLWRTLCTDKDVYGTRPAPAALGKCFKDFLCAWLCEKADTALSSHLASFAALSSALYVGNPAGRHEKLGTQAELMDRYEKEQRQGSNFGMGSVYFEQGKPHLSLMGRLIQRSSGIPGLHEATQACIPTMEDVQTYFEGCSTISVPSIAATQRLDAEGKKVISVAMPPPPLESDPTFVTVPIRTECRNAFAVAHDPVYSGRKLFLTEKGYLGLAPLDVEEGDRVFFLNGGRVPFILRAVGGMQFKLIGESYVHGVEHMLRESNTVLTSGCERIELI